MKIKVQLSQEEAELAGVRHVGPARARALRDAGILSIADLHAADALRIGGVKGVGLVNGQRIKEWLTAQSDSPVPPAAPVPVPTAVINQRTHDDLSSVDSAILRLQTNLTMNGPHKKLDKQVDKLMIVLSELAEAPDTLRPKQLARTVKMLEIIAALFDQFASRGTFSDKALVVFAEELRDRRRRLQKILDPKR